MPSKEKERVSEIRDPIEKPAITTWSAKEQEVDLAWIGENLAVFKETALVEYDEQGPGLIIVHTYKQLEEGGHLYGYLSQMVVEQFENERVTQLVREYDPKTETVIMLLKADYQENTYRVRFDPLD